jgi:trehalose utilization protein
MGKISVTVWNENVHELEMPEVAAIYPKGMHGCIADFLEADGGFDARTATPKPVYLKSRGEKSAAANLL